MLKLPLVEAREEAAMGSTLQVTEVGQLRVMRRVHKREAILVAVEPILVQQLTLSLLRSKHETRPKHRSSRLDDKKVGYLDSC